VIPYIPHPSLSIGAFTIYAFGVLVCLAIVVGFEIIVRRAATVGLDRTEAARLALWTLVSGLVGSHLVEVVAYHPEILVARPLAVFEVWGSMSSAGGIAGGLLGGALVMKWRGLSRADRARFLDCLAFAFPFAQIFGRGGCALAHDHLGFASTHWLAVRFPDGPRFDLGLLEWLFMLLLAGTFLLLDRRRWPRGFFLGLFLTLYGPARFVLDFLRIGDARYFGWTPAQYLALLATVAGMALLVAIVRWRLGADCAAPNEALRRRLTRYLHGEALKGTATTGHAEGGSR